MNDLEWANEELRAERAVTNELRRQIDKKDGIIRRQAERIAELEAEGEWLNRADRLAFDKASLEIDLLRERVAELEQQCDQMISLALEKDARISRLKAILDLINRCAGPAGKTCHEPGIKLSEAARRTLVESGHDLFKGEQVTW